jgi:hypothetical protein
MAPSRGLSHLSLAGHLAAQRRGRVADLALAFRPAAADPLAAFPDRAKGPLALSPEATEEWFERLTVREMRYWTTYLRARRGAPPDSLAAFPGAGEGVLVQAFRPVSRRAPGEGRAAAFGPARGPSAAWNRAQVPTDSL